MLFAKSWNWTDAAADGLPFPHYSLRHYAIAWVSRRVFDHTTYTVRHGLIRGMKRRGGLGWIPMWLSHGAQTREEMFWRDLLLDGMIVYDVGAYHGILTLFFASRAAQVIAYEPNEANHARLVENIWLNDLTNVEVRKLGVGREPGVGTLLYDPAMAGGGTLNPNASGRVSQHIEITSLDHDIAAAGLPPPNLIKIDIEGWELQALEGARGTLAVCHPAIFLEMHGESMREKRRKASEIVAFLREAGYKSILHIETGTAITAGNEAVAAEGHLYCQYTRSRDILWPTNISSDPPKANSES